MIIVLLANGFEEIEALTPVDMLRRAGKTVVTASVTGTREVCGSHGIPVIADTLAEEITGDGAQALILPGGMPGSLGLDASKETDRLINKILARGGRLAAICAAPLILGRRGILNGKRAVCYPGFENELIGATVCDAPVVTDGNITTAKGMGAALAFSKELISLLVSPEESRRLAEGICEN